MASYGERREPVFDDPAQLSAHRILGMLNYQQQYQLLATAELLQASWPNIWDSLIVELENGDGTRAAPAPPQAVKDFLTSCGEAGRACVEMWGGIASANTRLRVGILNERIDRILQPLTPDEANQALNWLESLSPSILTAVLLELAR
jgi:hypothetical protein